MLLYWLALLLTRITENATGDTWRNLRQDLHQFAAGEPAGPGNATITETLRPTPSRQALSKAYNVALPPGLIGIEPA